MVPAYILVTFTFGQRTITLIPSNGATTTDANLALGCINPHYFCGGKVQADMSAVDTALGKLAATLKTDRREAARGILRIANNNMVNAIKLISVNRGLDPRDFTLIAFGGGGGMHACALAADLGIRDIVIPSLSGVFSAWGMLLSDLRRDYLLTRIVELSGGRSLETNVKLFHNNVEVGSAIVRELGGDV